MFCTSKNNYPFQCNNTAATLGKISSRSKAGLEQRAHFVVCTNVWLYLRNYSATCHVSEMLSWQKWLMRRTDDGQKRVHVTSFSLLQLELGKSNSSARQEKANVHYSRALCACVLLKLDVKIARFPSEINQSSPPRVPFSSHALFIATMERVVADSRSDDFHVNAGITGAFQHSMYKAAPSARTFFNIALRASRIVGFNGWKKRSLDRFNHSYISLENIAAVLVLRVIERSLMNGYDTARIIVMSFIKPLTFTQLARARPNGSKYGK